MQATPTFAAGPRPPPNWPPRCAGRAGRTDALAAWHASYDYYDLVETPAAGQRGATARLLPAAAEIKSSHDPDQMIVSTHPVWPARVLA